jgi:alpha-L-fucosidase
MRISILLYLLLTWLFGSAQKNYIAPTDTLVLKKLDQWQDLKFGLFMHWGTYCQWGVVESWSICPEDEGWTQRKGNYSANYFDYKKAYEKLQYTFNPYYFNPENWVQAAKEAGMRYVVFTTKHHDGFCMFDTKETDYKITSPRTPFSYNPRSNVTREIFDAFRKQNFMVGAYFSKPDWHSENYWWPYFPPKDRNVNYDPQKYPDRWRGFKDFTYNQIKELMANYGAMDILWLDGGWVRPLSTLDSTVEWQKGIRFDQDIDMKRIAGMARDLQPGLIIVDRSVGGEFENYQTPEQQVPAEPLGIPWETCMTMGNSWSYVPGDHYKPARELIGLLIKIVSRGGNFLLNIGPGPEGDWDPEAYQRLKEMGAWIKLNGDGIYGSRPVAPYSSGNFYFTRSKDSSTVFAYYIQPDSLHVFTESYSIDHFPSMPNLRTVSLGGSSEKLRWKKEGDRIIIFITKKMQEEMNHQQPAAISFRCSN